MAPPVGGTRTPLDFTGPMNSVGLVTTNSVFGPGDAIQPMSDQPVRVYDFQVGVNTRIRPRADSPFSMASLRAFANVELVRMAIETRKDQLERLNWAIKPIDEKAAKGVAATGARVKNQTKFWRKPDQITPFASWLRQLMEDLLVLDAPTLECRRTRGGPNGVGKLLGLDVIPGDTIEPKVDNTGRRPRGPTDVAYQQVIKGLPWVDLSNSDIIYMPRNPRPNHKYGFGPVEQIIVTINTIMRRQSRQLAYFTESNVPAGLLNGPEGWSLKQTQDFQVWMDSVLAGQTDAQARLLWVPAGTKYTAFKDSPLKDDFDEWLARVVAYAFSLPATPFVKQMNKSTSDSDQDRSQEEGLEPIKLWVKRLVDGVIQDDMGDDDLEFVWVDTPSIDPKVQADIDNINLRNGSSTIDEVRDGRGDDPLPNGQGAQPLLYTGTGAMTLEQVLDAADKAINPVEPPTPLAINQAPAPGQEEPAGMAQPPAAKPAAPAAAPAPKPAAPAAKLAKASKLISATRPKARRAAASLKKALIPILNDAGDSVAAEIGRKLRGLKKADEGDTTAANLALATKLANQADLSDFDAIIDAAYDDLFEVVFDSGQLGLAQVGAATQDGLVDQIHARAVAYAKARGADLVSAQGDKNIIDGTRSAIRDILVKGLEDNIGSDAIADNIQASQAFSADRAQLIARSEIRMANADGKRSGWDAGVALGLVLTKDWQTTNDGNCCDECTENEAQGEIDYAENFASGAFDEGDSHPGCQCCVTVTATRPDDSEDGDE